jgi:hypothetical protein
LLPRSYGAEDPDRVVEIRPIAVARRIQTGRAVSEIQRKTGLENQDAVGLLAADDPFRDAGLRPALAEPHFVNEALHKDMSAVIVGARLVRVEIDVLEGV